MIKNFLAANSAIENEPITSTNAWRILGLFKKAYPSLRTDMSIETACQELEADPAALALRNSFFFPTLRNPAKQYLYNNQLKEIKRETFATLGNLAKLYLNKNQLKEIKPKTLANLQVRKILSHMNNPTSAAGPIHPPYPG